MSTVEFKYELGQTVFFEYKNDLLGGTIHFRQEGPTGPFYRVNVLGLQGWDSAHIFNCPEKALCASKGPLLVAQAEALEAQARAKRAEAERLGEAE